MKGLGTLIPIANDLLRCVRRAIPTIEVLWQIIPDIHDALPIEQVHCRSQGCVELPVGSAGD